MGKLSGGRIWSLSGISTIRYGVPWAKRSRKSKVPEGMEVCMESKEEKLCKSYQRPWGGGPCYCEENLRLLPGEQDELQGIRKFLGAKCLSLECRLV